VFGSKEGKEFNEEAMKNKNLQVCVAKWRGREESGGKGK
jgi:hypothetical protein